MTNYRIRAMIVATIVVAGCGVSGGAAPSSAQTPAPVGGADPTRFTEADVRFMSGMIGHHAQAIIMSRMAATHGASRPVQILAARIINAQVDEIALMQQWLRDRNQPVPDTAVAAGHAHHDVAHDQMPGMLTAAQLQQLDAARGREFDQLFLRFMIQHHQGAVAMVNALTATAGAAQHDATFKIVSDVNVDQATEIERMQKMLYELVIGKEDE